MKDKTKVKRKILIDRNFPDSDQIKKHRDFNRINSEYNLIKKLRKTFILKSIIGFGIILIVGMVCWQMSTSTQNSDANSSDKIDKIDKTPDPLVNKKMAITDNEENKKSDQVSQIDNNTKPEIKQTLQKNEEKATPAPINKVEVKATVPIAIAEKNTLATREKQHELLEEKIAVKDSIESPAIKKQQAIPAVIDSDKIIYNTSTIEIQPEFPGGHTALMKFLNDNLKYPDLEKGNNVQGKTFVSFVIDKSGRVTRVEVAKGIPDGGRLDKEAVRVVKMMPYWKPGKQNGKPVSVQYMLPIQFKTIQ